MSKRLTLREAATVYTARKAAKGARMTDQDRCQRCNSPAPHLHPAVQHEGEVQICTDQFHARRTPQNERYLADVEQARSKQEAMQ